MKKMVIDVSRQDSENVKLILASSSPRRKELLTQIGVRFEALYADVDEEAGAHIPPDKLVVINAEKKALRALELLRDRSGSLLVLACDTLVYSDGLVLGKPADEREAHKMLRMLSNKWHTVYTGVCIIAPNGASSAFANSAEVFMRALTDGEIQSYIETGEPMDKAGAYGIQGIGSVFIEKINGDYYTVVGLPVCRLFTELERLGCKLL